MGKSSKVKAHNSSSSTTPTTAVAKGSARASRSRLDNHGGALALLPNQPSTSGGKKRLIVETPPASDDEDEEIEHEEIEDWRIQAAHHRESAGGTAGGDHAYQPSTADELVDDLIDKVENDGPAPRDVAQFQKLDHGEVGDEENEDTQLSLIKQYMAMQARKAEAALVVQKQQTDVMQAILQSFQAGQASIFGSTGATHGPMVLPGPTKFLQYPFIGDGKTKKGFGSDRARVYDAVLAVWVPRQGENGGVLPSYIALSVAAEALGVAANDGEATIAFGVVFGCAVTTVKSEVKKDFCSIVANKLLDQHGVSPIKTGKTGEVPPHIQEHMAKFPTLKSRPPPYHNRPLTEVSIYMMAIHANYSVELNCLAAFEKTEWRTFFDKIFGWAGVPPSGARIDTPRAVAHLVMVMMAKLTFAAPPTPAGVAIYGSLGGSWDQGVIEDIAAWLMDADKCPTTWAPLLAIRQQHGARWRNTA